MDWLEVFLCACGYEQLGDQIRVYVDGPTPAPSVARFSGVRTQLFRLFAGMEAESIRRWLARNRAWQCLRVSPPFSTELGARALLLASDWHSGEGSAMYGLARTRTIRDEAHRQRLQREARCLIGSVLENPVRDGEFEELQLLEDVVNTAPAGKELATTAEVVDAYFRFVR